MRHINLTVLALLLSLVSFAQVDPITGTLSVCAGGTTALSSTTPGGVWTSSTAVATVGSASGIVTGITTGTATITYTVGSSGYVTANVTVNPLPTAFALMGGGSFCAGGTGVTVGLASSVTGVSYQLFNSGTPVGSPVAGTGSALSFGAQTAAGIYTVMATNNSTACSRIMTGTAAVAINALPTAFAVSGGGSYCLGGAGVPVGLNASNSGITYQLFRGTTVVGAVSGTGASFDFGLQTVAGTYTIIGINPTTGCVANMIGSALVAVTTGTCTGTPSAGAAEADINPVCSGNPVTLTLDGAACGTTIQWQQSADMTTWTNITGASNFTYTHTPSVSRYYRSMATCVSSGLSANSSPVYVRVSNGLQVQSVSYPPDTICNGPNFFVSACGISSTFKVVTWYGDNASDTTNLTTSGLCHATISHHYAHSGTYTVKQVLLNGTSVVDSASYSYEYVYCRFMPIRFYLDANSNCAFDEGDIYNLHPLTIEIDSSGHKIDTISVVSGFYYKAIGAPGTIYAFRLLSAGGALLASCPSSGILYDTIQPYLNDNPVKYFGLNCSGSTSFDLAEHVFSRATPTTMAGSIYVHNRFCTPRTATVTLHFNPRYNFTIGSPAPTSVVGNVATWNLSGVSYTTPAYIYYQLTVSGTSFALNDTVHTTYTVSPITGDSDTTNNVIQKCDTVRGSYDPNDIAVTPEGYILPCTQLQYRIRFENTGNDTAHNIYVLDTLSANLDPQSLEIVFASAAMNVVMLNDGGYNIAKFDFPGIKLLDSSHHGLCDGMIVYNIKAKAGMPDGVAVRNRAGIYFDDNSVILTNTVENTGGIGPINGLPTVCVAAYDTLSNTTAGGVWSSSNTNATVAAGIVTGVTAGTSTISYIISNVCATRTATKVITINPLPDAGTITGAGDVCIGASIALADLVTGGTWSSGSPAVAVVSGGGTVSGISASSATISYTTSNSCGIISATKIITVNPLPAVYTVTGGGSYCAGSGGAGIAQSNSEAGTNYQLYIGATGIGAPLAGTGTAASFGMLTGAGNYHVVATNATTGCSSIMNDTVTITVTPSVIPSVIITHDAPATICTGTPVTYTANPTNGGTAPTYEWRVNGAVAGSGSVYSYMPANGDFVTARLTSNAICPLPDTALNSVAMSVVNLSIPSVAITANPGTTLSPGQTTTLTAVVTGSANTFQWIINSTPVPGATSATYTSNILYNNDSVSCIVTSNDPCGQTSFNSVIINVTTVGVPINGYHSEMVMLTPNPNKGIFTINGATITGDGEVSVIITNTLGQRVYTTSIMVKNGVFNKQVDLGNIVSGTYLLNLRSGTESKVFRFVVD